MVAREHPLTPHDALVRYVFCRPAAVAVVLRRVLPARLLACLDLGSLRYVPTIYTNPLLVRRESDLLFTVDLVVGGQRSTIYIAIEHQSTHEALLPWRALVYMGDIWGRHIGRCLPRGRSLPFVLPVAFLQPRAWDSPVRLSGIVEVPSIVRETLGARVELDMLVDDLSGTVLDDPVTPAPFQALVELTRILLYAHDNPRAVEDPRFSTVPSLFDLVLKHFGPDDVKALWNYVITAFEEGSPVRRLVLESVSTVVREVYMTIAEELLARGEAKGRMAGLSEGRMAGLSEGRLAGLSEGRIMAKVETLLDLLEHRRLFVPEAVRERVRTTADEPVLQRWIRRAATATSLEQVFES